MTGLVVPIDTVETVFRPFYFCAVIAFECLYILPWSKVLISVEWLTDTEVKTKHGKQVPQVENCICNYNFKPHAFPATLNNVKIEHPEFFVMLFCFIDFF